MNAQHQFSETEIIIKKHDSHYYSQKSKGGQGVVQTGVTFQHQIELINKKKY